MTFKEYIYMTTGESPKNWENRIYTMMTEEEARIKKVKMKDEWIEFKEEVEELKKSGEW